jgi:hypothetical protein
MNIQSVLDFAATHPLADAAISFAAGHAATALTMGLTKLGAWAGTQWAKLKKQPVTAALIEVGAQSIDQARDGVITQAEVTSTAIMALKNIGLIVQSTD